MMQLEQAKLIVRTNYDRQLCKNPLSVYANLTAGLRLCYCSIKYSIVDIVDYSERTPTRIKLKKIKDGKQHFLILIQCVYFDSQYSSLKQINREIVCVHVRNKTGRVPKAGKSQRPKTKNYRKYRGIFIFMSIRL